ncbi:MAG: RNA methyltransferase [Labilithrix sp.]|nr:RNA methyltransferase [Labilithrix sp.]MBX3223482.1 RNA methyltransferase [Labilithrix sp.]
MTRGGRSRGGAERPPRPRHEPPPASRAGEADADALERVHGLRAGLAVLAKRPADVVRVACASELVGDVERALGERAAHVRIGVLADRDIEKLARSNQHEGLVLEARARRWATPHELGELLAGGSRRVAIALDRVRNSYNVGAILRSAAFFGVDAALLGAPAPHPGLDPNAIRVAEGGVEDLVVARTTDLADTLGRLRARGVKVYGADGHADADALAFDYARPSILVMGNEREGLGPRVRAQCDAILAIRGSGNVESLNVGVAAGILIAGLAGRR